MAGALKHGALDAASEMDAATFTIEKKRACDATLDDLLQASGHLFCAPETLASTSGDARALPQDVLGGAVQGGDDRVKERLETWLSTAETLGFKLSVDQPEALRCLATTNDVLLPRLQQRCAG